MSSLRPLQQPIPTLFPYTTLFRSGRREGRGAGRQLRRSMAGDAQPGRGQARPAKVSVLGTGAARSDEDRDQDVLDRKSTRLNSSHLGISYAVFCLKKKINGQEPDSSHFAIGTSALAVSVNAFANLIHHARRGNVRWRVAGVFAVRGIIGATVCVRR